MMRAAAVLLLVLWVPVTAHCKLEVLSGLEFLACCLHPDTAPHQDQDCDSDACAVVESGSFLLPAQRPNLVPPLVPVCVLAAAAVEVPMPESFLAKQVEAAPPELARCWQFSLRAALRPRAPSFCS